MTRTFLTLGLMAMTLTSCLDENPKDQIEENKIYTSASDIYVNAVASLYNYIGSNTECEGLQGTCRGIFDYNTFSTDEVMNPIRGGDWYDGGLWQNLYLHEWVEDDSYTYNVWKYLFKVIVLCNQSLSVIEEKQGILTDAQKQSYEAEVRAVRAMFYYYAMDFFGRVPLVTSASATMNEVKQSERSEIYHFVIKEFQSVVPLLPNEHSNLEGNYYGRITRPVVYFLLAKLMLNAEIYNDNNWTDSYVPNGSNIYFDVEGEQLNAWEACQRYCDFVKDSGYELENDYSTNFSIHNENSKENIFTIPMDKTIYAAEYHYLFRSLHYKHGGALSRASENGTCATVSTVKAYGYGTDNVDSRLSKNLYVDTVYVDGAKVMLDNGNPLVYQPLEVEMNLTFSDYIQTAGARLAKYEIDRTAYSDGKMPNNDIVLFRYADVLLMKAEAKIRNGQDGSEELNQVRARVGMPSIAATLDNVLKERLLELFFEGWRRQDLVRFGQFHKAYDQRAQTEGENDRHTTVFPIPQKCIDLNPLLKQNPGYGE